MLGPVPFFSLKTRLACLCLTLLLLPYASFSESSPPSSPAPKSKLAELCRIDMRRIAKTLGGTLLIAGALVATPRATYSTIGFLEGTPHIGSGVFLDIEKVEELLSPAENELLKDVEANKKAIIEMFAEKFSGDYDSEYLKGATHYRPLRTVSSYMKGSGTKLRGICRDKRRAAQAVYAHYGIHTEVRTFSGSATQPNGHEALYVPEFDAMIDPTMNDFGFKLVDAKKYYQDMIAWGFVPDADSFKNDALRYISESFQR